MNIHCVEGIVLQAIPFRDYDQIATVFSDTQGIITLILKQARRAKKGLSKAVYPLTCAEFIYREGKSEIMTCSEMTVLDLFLPLREKLTALEAACEMLKALQKSQHPGISSPLLYQLLKTYLKIIGSDENVNVFVASFFLKILMHDGLWDPENNQIPDHLFLSEEERSHFNFLATCRAGSALSKYVIDHQLKKKIGLLFEESIKA